MRTLHVRKGDVPTPSLQEYSVPRGIVLLNSVLNTNIEFAYLPGPFDTMVGLTSACNSSGGSSN